MKDYYLILGIDEDATDEEIKTAFRRLMKIWHPDICTRKNANEKFAEIVEAYKALTNKNERLIYDQMRKSSLDNPVSINEKQRITGSGCLIISFLILLSLGFVAFIAYKVYLTLYGPQIIPE